MSEAGFPRIFGAYELLGRLGSGAAGEANLARPTLALAGVPSPVVIKRLHDHIESQGDFVQRFRHEAEIAVRVDSPYVAKTFDVGAVSGRPYIALEYVPGWTLGRMLGVLNQRRRPPSLEVCKELALQLVEGLVALHGATDARGRALEVVHRDISPKNVMVGDDGRIRIIDLGLGKSNAQDWRTRAGRVMGSPGYMPPEQIDGRDVGQPADVYATAILVHELYTAERYIKSGDPVTMLRAALQKRYEPLRGKRPDVPASLDAVLEAATRHEQHQRTPSARRLLDDLVGALGPRRGDERAVAHWVKATLPAEQRARREEVERLLAHHPAPMEEEDAGATVVFVSREGVAHGAPAATRVHDMAGTQVLLPPTSVTGTESGQLPAVTRSRGHGRVAVAFVVGLSVGAVGMRILDRAVDPVPLAPTVVREAPRPAEPRAAEAHPTALRTDPEPRPAPETRPPVEPRRVEPPTLDPPPRDVRPATPDRSPERPRRPKRPEASPPQGTEAAAEALAARIQRRASLLRRSGNPAEVKEATRVLGRLPLVKRVSDPERRLEQLRQLETALEM